MSDYKLPDFIGEILYLLVFFPKVFNHFVINLCWWCVCYANELRLVDFLHHSNQTKVFLEQISPWILMPFIAVWAPDFLVLVFLLYQISADTVTTIKHIGQVIRNVIRCQTNPTLSEEGLFLFPPLLFQHLLLLLLKFLVTLLYLGIEFSSVCSMHFWGLWS